MKGKEVSSFSNSPHRLDVLGGEILDEKCRECGHQIQVFFADEKISGLVFNRDNRFDAGKCCHLACSP